MELKAEVVVHAPARAAWVVLGERFGEIGHWATPISASSIDSDPRVGAIRTCQIAGFGPVKPGLIRERLIAFDAAAMSFAYEAAAGMPRFIVSAVNRWSVHATGETTCIVRTHATLELRGPMRLFGFLLQRKMTTDGRRVLDELSHQVEHGTPHPRKLAAMARTSAPTAWG